jgi:DNA-binding beta-propeller fold protein YncE
VGARAWVALVSLALLGGGSSGAASVAAGLPLRTVASVRLPGASNRFDYLSLDAKTNKLYIAHMNDDHIVVFDIRRRRVVTTIPAPGVHGVLAVPELGRVFASATNVRQVFTIEEKSDSVVGRAPAGAYPDGIAWDPVERHAFVSDETGGVETVVNAAGRRVATVAVGGEAGNVQYDAGARRILVDVQSRNDIAVIDPRRNRVVRRVALPGCAHPHGLLVDSRRRLAFVACDGNARLLTLDLTRLRVTGRASIGASPDVLALDRSLDRLYIAGERGDVAVFAENAHGLKKLGQARLAPNAHTVAVDSRTHLVYFPLERGQADKPELRIMAPR